MERSDFTAPLTHAQTLFRCYNRDAVKSEENFTALLDACALTAEQRTELEQSRQDNFTSGYNVGRATRMELDAQRELDKFDRNEKARIDHLQRELEELIRD